ncbi:myelin-oligodendrocyte glycoprotein-like isoform X2 [Oryzias latipes]|uniref:myelin-oligodendrocyte glycoprotein-like isoform X2 n=1 Tax=Oryzias latipes TaxID=8090 RepID=UPI000CE16FE9|nr:myelin-oligodendrocyte glycoprotein-like isoform X2 [Oryzias latipes]
MMSAAEFCCVSASSLWISACVWFWFCSHVEGEPIIAAPGDDVILPCRLDSQEDLRGFSVEWIKVDMKPDPQGRIPFVYLYWNGQTMTKFMIPSLILRVSLDQDGLKRGDVTLKIRNVSLQDEGKYSCFIPGKNFRETVQLVVEPNGVRAPTMETSQVDIISTPDPGGDRIWISRSRPALWILLGLFPSVILSAVCVCVCQRKQPEGQNPPLV